MVSVPEAFDPGSVGGAGYSTPAGVDFEVALAAGCAWVDAYRAGDDAAKAAALEELEAVDEWPLYERLQPPVQGLVAGLADGVTGPDDRSDVSACRI